MRSPVLTLISAFMLACGTFVCAADPPPTSTPSDGVRTAVQQLNDQLIGLRLEPPVDEAMKSKASGDGTIRLRARVRPVKESKAQADKESPATQPVQDFLVDIDVSGPDARRVYDVGQLRIDAGELKSADRLVAEDVRLSLLSIAADQKDGAYLGVGVDAPDETLRDQLDLAPGAGLVVNFVDDNGPAKAAVRPHDVLQKVDDQLLVNSDQLIALIRMRKPGETVSLTLLRHAKPVTVQVELGQRKPDKAEKRSSASDAGWQQTLPNYTWFASPTDVQNLSSVYVGASNDFVNHFQPQPLKFSYLEPRDQIEQRPITFNDGQMLATFGKGDLLAIDLKDGNVIYHGPIGTAAQWNAMPKLLKDKLSSWRSLVCPGPADKTGPEKR